jgi:hypothetical protein
MHCEDLKGQRVAVYAFGQTAGSLSKSLFLTSSQVLKFVQLFHELAREFDGASCRTETSKTFFSSVLISFSSSTDGAGPPPTIFAVY